MSTWEVSATRSQRTTRRCSSPATRKSKKSRGTARARATRPPDELWRPRSTGRGPAVIWFDSPNPDIVLLHQRLEIGALHAGFFGALGNVPGVPLERLENEQLLDVFHRLLPRDFLDSLELVAGSGHVEIEPRQRVDDICQVSLANDLVGGKDHRSVYGILEFAHISRPVMVHQRAHGPLGKLGHFFP